MTVVRIWFFTLVTRLDPVAATEQFWRVHRPRIRSRGGVDRHRGFC